MRSSLRDDKNSIQTPPSQNLNSDVQKDRKIKRLTMINRELIQTLKQQNQQLSKRISKQKMKGGRSLSMKNTPKVGKELESVRKELSNAYKQIDMYKNIVQDLKAKEVPLDHVDKINDLETKVKMEDSLIENYQKEIKYTISLREKQEKELKIYENEEVKQNKITLEKQIAAYKQKIKTLKKNAIKRQQVQKRQHSYFVELQKALRVANDEYYPGKAQPKEKKEDDAEITEVQWNTVKSKVTELKRLYQEYNKKLDLIARQKIREMKSFQQNQLKLKQKSRKLATLRSRVLQLTKLTILKQPKQAKQPLPPKRQQVKNDKNKSVVERQVKKWNVPEGFSMQKGKVLPNSTFISDKAVLLPDHKYKMVEAEVWCDGNGVPNLLRFIYQNQIGERLQGKEQVQSIPQNLQLASFKLKEKDYFCQISGKFTHGFLASLTLRSKLGQQQTYQDPNSYQAGDSFSFIAKPNDLPACFYSATIKGRDGDVRICYLGCEFMSDW